MVSPGRESRRKNSSEPEEDGRHGEKASRRWTAVNSVSQFSTHDLCLGAPLSSLTHPDCHLPLTNFLAAGESAGQWESGNQRWIDPALITLWRSHPALPSRGARSNDGSLEARAPLL